MTTMAVAMAVAGCLAAVDVFIHPSHIWIERLVIRLSPEQTVERVEPGGGLIDLRSFPDQPPKGMWETINQPNWTGPSRLAEWLVPVPSDRPSSGLTPFLGDLLSRMTSDVGILSLLAGAALAWSGKGWRAALAWSGKGWRARQGRTRYHSSQEHPVKQVTTTTAMEIPMQPSVPATTSVPEARATVEQVLQALAARSKMYSPTFWPRALAVWGHVTAVGMVIVAGIKAVQLVVEIVAKFK
jgi:hypothetical protein